MERLAFLRAQTWLWHDPDAQWPPNPPRSAQAPKKILSGAFCLFHIARRQLVFGGGRGGGRGGGASGGGGSSSSSSSSSSATTGERRPSTFRLDIVVTHQHIPNADSLSQGWCWSNDFQL